MTLSAGTRLGPYEIVAPLGAGGMGEVYRARDTRLAREVAVKVLPESLASDQERLRRFEKEAKSASALNHPNIVTIHDIGSESGVSYIAMELVDGATLREILASGALPIKKLLHIAPQIAEGLARAHEAGIVHRDLKPENVMVKKDGLVKILDFGLAKLSSTGSGSGEGSQLPTMTGTQPGVVVGTVSYMSPEQASGQTVDFRSDQFSLGSMLYEMATGKRAFQKKTAIDTLSAILNEEPQPITAASPQTPTPLRWIVERCLSKESQLRYASTEDLARDLSNVRDHLSKASSASVLATAAGAGRAPHRLVLPILAAAVTLIAVGVSGGVWYSSRHARNDFPIFRRLTFGRGNLLTARFAPDGKTVAYGAAWDGKPTEIFTVRTDSVESRPLGLSGADVMSVSSKGELAVLIHKSNLLVPVGTGTLARVSIAGGTPRELLEDVVRADWAPNGEDLAVIRLLPNGKLRLQYPIGTVLAELERSNEDDDVRVSPNGDLVACSSGDAIVTFDRKGKRHEISRGWRLGWLAWSPRGDEIIFMGARADNQWAIRAVSLSGRGRVLVPGPGPLWLTLHDVGPDGRLLVESGVNRDELACRPRGENRERELGSLESPVATYIAEDGKLVLSYDASEQAGDPGIYLGRTDGTPAVRLGVGHAKGLSADGRWVLNCLKGPPAELIMMPTGPGNSRRIPVEGIEPLDAWLLPNDKGFLVRGANKDGGILLAVVGPNGGKPRPLGTDGTDREVVISPDGERFVYVTKDGTLKIARIADGNATTVPGPSFALNDRLLQWSADGRFLYVSRFGGFPVPIDRLELASGRREPWKNLAPADPTGATWVGGVALSPDGESYAYNYVRSLVSDLYVVGGVK